ncbi:transcription antitermination protein NusB [Candidatus Karelsulcia muelleri]|uniref:transcription antitermination protein NusB n=1 Tax=Candidatus Karelsulcia muelleri TaxID=336810 RepID=UPI0035C9099E
MKFLIRRNLRIRVMQFLYAYYLSNTDSNFLEKKLFESIYYIYDIYIFFLNLIIILRKIIIKKNFYKINYNFYFFKKNSLIELLSKKKKIIFYNYKINFLYKKKLLKFLLKKLKTINLVLNKKKYDFYRDKEFILKYYKYCFSKNKFLYKFLKNYDLTCFINMNISHLIVYNFFFLIKKKKIIYINIYKNKKQINFIKFLYKNTIFYQKYLNILIEKISQNWKITKLSIINLIILQMSICELIFFKKIPFKVTLNEYIEITKIFSTKKSKIYINGILDKVVKILLNKKKL